MITEISIENFKSIQKLDLSLGRVTVLIGENGCGKSNILEAIAFASAAAADRLDNEFLVPRGIRVPDDPGFMRAAFELGGSDNDINISIPAHEVFDAVFGNNPDNIRLEFILRNENSPPYSKWVNAGAHLFPEDISAENLDFIRSFITEFEQTNKLFELDKDRRHAFDRLKIMANGRDGTNRLRNFVIYAPENTVLRKFEEEGQIQPLGIKGEGLFKLLTVLNLPENADRLADIKCKLRLLDWFRDFELGGNIALGERIIRIKDKYLDSELEYFTQRSANEGFLFLLFYFALFAAKETPAFFAIDNIDASLNPKLCERLMIDLVELAKKYNKQVIMTTHNPALLDGLNINDDEQRLYVVSRNIYGHTKTRRVSKPKPLEGQEPVRFSEAFLRGYLGGLPNNF